MIEMGIKRGHYKTYDGDVESLMEDIFGNVVEKDGWYVSEYGAMQPIRAKIQGKSKIFVDINTKKDVDAETAMDTIRAKNKFLEAATGYNSKERAKKLKQMAKKGKF